MSASVEDKIRWICAPCGHKYGKEQDANPVSYTGMDCSWCQDEGAVVFRPDVFGIPVRNPETKQLELDV